MRLESAAISRSMAWCAYGSRLAVGLVLTEQVEVLPMLVCVIQLAKGHRT